MAILRRNDNGAAKGKAAEKEFGKELWFRFGVQPIESTTEEDMFSHWDFRVQGYKYDAKSKERTEVDGKKYIWVEFKNVRGKKGWLFGEADYIAFDFDTFWMVAGRKKLLEVIKPKVDWDTLVDEVDEKIPWTMYSRRGREDGVMWIDVLSIMETEPQIWWKS